MGDDTFLFIGIDPGLHGAVSCITVGGAIDGIHDGLSRPADTGKGRRFNVARMLAILTSHSPELSFACIEQQQAMSKQGVTSTFRIGEGYGLWLGMLAALRIPHAVIRSQEWKKEYGLIQRGADTKARKAVTLECAERLFPCAELRGPKGGMLDGRADALLIGEYARRHFSTFGATVHLTPRGVA